MNYGSASKRTASNAEIRQIDSNSPLPERICFHSNNTLPRRETSMMSQDLRTRMRSSIICGEDWIQFLWILSVHMKWAIIWLTSAWHSMNRNTQPDKYGNANAKWWPEHTVLGAPLPQSHRLIIAIWENHCRDRLHLARLQNRLLHQVAI